MGIDCGYQVPVVQTMDSAIHWISDSETNCNIQWIVIYPVDNVIHRLNNWGQVISGFGRHLGLTDILGLVKYI